LIDNSNKVNGAGADAGWMAVHTVQVRNPVNGLPSTWLNDTGWLRGKTCGTMSWQGVQCNEGHITALRQLGDCHPSQRLHGRIDLVDFSGLGNVSAMDFSENQLNGTLSDDSLPLTLTDLRLGANLLNGYLPTLSRMFYLSHLNLSRQDFAGQIPDYYLEFPYSGYDDQPSIDREMPGRVGPPYALKVLDLSYNTIVGSIPLGLSRHPTLEVLILRNNELMGTIPSPLGLPLWKLDLANNALSGVAPLRQPGFASVLRTPAQTVMASLWQVLLISA